MYPLLGILTLGGGLDPILAGSHELYLAALVVAQVSFGFSEGHRRLRAGKS